MTKHSDKVYLGHILESIEKVEAYIASFSLKKFKDDDRTIDAVIRNFEIIGEASNNISDKFRESHPEVSFRPAIDMRNRLAHGYDEINLATIWDAACDDLPDFKIKVKKLFDSEK